MNLHSLGSQLKNNLRKDCGHAVRIRRGIVTSDSVYASSGPIGHITLNEEGVEILDHDRTFFIKVSDYKTAVSNDEPRLNDVIIDDIDNSEWVVQQQGGDYAWQWSDQNRTEYMIKTSKI
jgi:hypothetical protein